jgi:hypothetical protein
MVLCGTSGDDAAIHPPRRPHNDEYQRSNCPFDTTDGDVPVFSVVFTVVVIFDVRAGEYADGSREGESAFLHVPSILLAVPFEAREAAVHLTYYLCAASSTGARRIAACA